MVGAESTLPLEYCHTGIVAVRDFCFVCRFEIEVLLRYFKKKYSINIILSNLELALASVILTADYV